MATSRKSSAGGKGRTAAKKPVTKKTATKKPAIRTGREKLAVLKPSGGKDDSFFDLVHEVARQIPKGRVTSYGAIAACLGTRGSARMVGWAMMAVPNAKKPVPAHRVVNRNGLLTGRHHYTPPEKMQQLLEKDGVVVKDNQVVHFARLFWDPSKELCVGLLLAMTLFIFPLTQRAQSPYSRQYVMVAGKKMSYTSFGLATRRPDSPVLIFEAGFGASGATNFKGLFPAMSKIAAGIGYDRNGEGGSEEDTTLVTDGDIIRRLHAFLEAVHVSPPYLLVGHSLGGPFIRLYTALYPAEVAGLVFIDPPDFMLTEEQTHQINTVAHKDVGAGIIRSLDSTVADTLWGPLVRHRARRLANLFRKGIFGEYHKLPPLPDIPVAILIAYNKPVGKTPRTAAELARSNVIDHFRLENFTTMIGNNHNSELIVLPGYGHIIHGEDPALVVAAIERIYQKVGPVHPVPQ